MNAKTFAILLLGLVLGATGSWWLRPQAMAPDSATAAPIGKTSKREILYYRNPMGQPDTSPVPKKDSMGMDYLPVFADEVEDVPGLVALSPQRIQTLGVRTGVVQNRIARDLIRASGRIEVDQSRRQVIAPKFDGWIERLYANQSGQALRRGQALMAVYSPELVSTQNEFLIAQAAARQLPAGDSAAAMQRLADAALLRLRNFDIPPAQVEKLRQGESARLLTLTAPADAVILEPPMVAGSRFMAGDTVLTMADLSKVWLVASVPTLSSSQVEIGQPVHFSSAALPGRDFEGNISFVDPMLDAGMRTLEIRVELDNPEGVLRPALYGDVLIEVSGDQAQLLVPRSAVLDSGTRQTVFVEVSPGRFEPRAVKLGSRAGDEVVVLGGLRAGESVVVAANFLIDAESNLRAALQSLQPDSETSTADAMPAQAEDH